MMDRARRLLHRPRSLGGLAATLATAIGITVMAAGGAPRAYLAINAAALVIGLALLALSGRRDTPNGGAVLLAAAALLATALFGTPVDDAARWVRVGVVSLQPSLILLPLMVIAFARARDTAGTLAMLVAALALALQPDRAMAGVLAAGLGALMLQHREPRVVVAFVAALAGFGATLLQPDTLPPTPFVEQVLVDAFAVSPLSGAALLAGAALLFLPILTRGAAALPVFAAVWLAILLAAVLGNYPTPLLGYGGSAIIGYLLCLAALPPRVGAGSGDSATTAAPRRDGSADLLVAAR